MAHRYSPFLDSRSSTDRGFKTQWCAGQSPDGPLQKGATYQSLVRLDWLLVLCFKNKNKENCSGGHSVLQNCLQTSEYNTPSLNCTKTTGAGLFGGVISFSFLGGIVRDIRCPKNTLLNFSSDGFRSIIKPQ